MIAEGSLGVFLRIAAVAAGFVVFFLSGIFPVEDYLALLPRAGLTASVVPADVASLTNAERVKNGLPALTVSPLLTKAAQLKAEDMAAHSYYAHVGPDGRTPLYWLNTVGYKYLNAGENLVIDRKSSEAAVDAWMNSPDHRENILRPQFTEFGIGVAKGEYDGIPTIFVVQEFGKPYPTAPQVAKVVPQPKPVAKPISTTTPSLATNVAAIAQPVVTPITKAVIAPKQAKAPEVATSTLTQASSSIAYTLAPGFFTPVSIPLTKPSDATASTSARAPEAESTRAFAPPWVSRVAEYIRHIALAVPRVW